MADIYLQIDFLLSGLRYPDTDIPLSGGKVYTYLDGTSTLSNLKVDQAGAGAAANPVILGTDGTAEVYGDQIYKFMVYDSDDNLIDTLNGLQYKANIAVTKKLSIDYGCDLAAAVAAIGSTTQTELDVECACVIASGTSVTVPDNISVNVKNGGSFDGVAGGSTETITFEKVQTAGDYTIFGDNITIVYSKPEVIKAVWYNLKGDETNDNAALQRAVTSALTAEGSVLRLPLSDGIHITGITIPAASSHLTIEGAAYNQTKIEAHSSHVSTTSLFDVGVTGDGNECDHITFRNLWFNQPGAAYGDNAQCAAVELTNTNNVIFDNCQWNRFQHAVLAYDADDLNFVGDIKVMACGYSGSGMGALHFDGCNTVHFVGHTLERTYEYGIYLTKTGDKECNGIHIQNNKIHGRTSGDEGSTLGLSQIVVDGANIVLITGNNLSNCRNEPGIVIRDEDGSTAGTYSRTHTTVCNNVIEGENTLSMLYVDTGDPLSRVIVDNNHFPDEFTTGSMLKVGANVLPMNLHWGFGNTTNEENTPGDWLVDDTSGGWGGKIAFTFEKTVDLGTAAQTFTVLTVPANMTFIPEICNMKFDTTITGTAGDYIGLGVNDTNQRNYCGYSGVNVGGSWAGNNYRMYYPAATEEKPYIVGGDVVRLIVTVSDNYDTAQTVANTIGGSGESITVSISGYLLSNHP